jgi:hypothetical protein
MGRLDTSRTAGFVEALEALVPKRLDHPPSLACCALRNNRAV